MTKKDFEKKKSALEKSYKVLRNKMHPVFGEITVWINPSTRKTIFSKEIILNDKKEAKDMLE